MSKSDAFENGLLLLIFNNTALALIGDAAGLQPSAAPGNLYVALHTSDPGETGDQTTNEGSYTGYARVAVVRSSAGWTISGTAPSQAANAAIVSFPQCTGLTMTATHFSVGTALSGAGERLYSAALTAPLAISNLITPTFQIGTLVVTED